MDPFIGQIQLLPFTFSPQGWALCEGQLLSISQNTALFALLGTTFGGDGIKTFALPDLREKEPVPGSHYCIALEGVFPARDVPSAPEDIETAQESPMEPFLGQIQLLAFDFSPHGWASCEGQLLPLSQNAALYALLGTTYGGDGVATFALPDLRGKEPVAGSRYCIALQGIFPSRG